MANVLINEQHLADIANAIREQSLSEDTYKPREMAAAIQAIGLRQGITGDDLFAGIPHAIYAETATTLTNYIAGTKVTAIHAPNARQIESNAFNRCNYLTEFRGPNVSTINGGAFYGCPLETIELGNVRHFAPSQWFGLTGKSTLKTVILRVEGYSCIYEVDSPDSGWRLPDGCYVYLPRQVYETAMKDGTSWADLGERDHLRVIEDYPEICG